MNKRFKLAFLLLVSIAFLVSGCKHKKAKPRYHKTHTRDYGNNNYQRDYQQFNRPVPRDMEYPQNYPSIPARTNSGYGTYQAPTRHIQKPKISRSMEELTRDSGKVKPTLVYSYPKNASVGGAIFVNLTPIKYRMLEYINSLRTHGTVCSNPSPPIGWNRSLENAASMHARDMAANRFLGHLGSGGVTDLAKRATGGRSNFYERIIYAGYPVKSGELAGEILTYTKFRIVGNQDPYANFEHAIDNFLRSPRHCSILTNPRFKDVGVAAYRDSEKIYWVIEFGEVNY